jgi:hypothetical protein
MIYLAGQRNDDISGVVRWINDYHYPLNMELTESIIDNMNKMEEDNEQIAKNETFLIIKEMLKSEDTNT